MEPVVNPGNSSRRDEDIALDLLKFVAATTGAGRTAPTRIAAELQAGVRQLASATSTLLAGE